MSLGEVGSAVLPEISVIVCPVRAVDHLRGRTRAGTESERQNEKVNKLAVHRATIRQNFDG